MAGCRGGWWWKRSARVVGWGWPTVAMVVVIDGGNKYSKRLHQQECLSIHLNNFKTVQDMNSLNLHKLISDCGRIKINALNRLRFA